MLLPVGGRRHRRRQEGFTLIELGVVLAIIAILVAIAVPTYSNMTKRAHQAEAAQAWDMVKSEVWAYYIQHDSFPSTSGGWPQDIDDPNRPNGYWTYSANSVSTGNNPYFTLTATTSHSGGSTVSWTIYGDGSIVGP